MRRTDGRVEPRRETAPIRVEVSGYCQRIYGYARNLSRSGMQVRTFDICGDPAQEGECVSISFPLPGDGRAVDCVAEVVWNRTPPEGLAHVNVQGLRFTSLDPRARKVITDWVGD